MPPPALKMPSSPSSPLSDLRTSILSRNQTRRITHIALIFAFSLAVVIAFILFYTVDFDEVFGVDIHEKRRMKYRQQQLRKQAAETEKNMQGKSDDDDEPKKVVGKSIKDYFGDGDVKSTYPASFSVVGDSAKKDNNNLALPPGHASVFDDGNFIKAAASGSNDAAHHLDPLSPLPASLVQYRNRAQRLSKEEKAAMKQSLKLLNQKVDDDDDDEEFDRLHPVPNQKPGDTGPPCILFRYLPNCTCRADGVKGGSHCLPRGLGRCDHKKCFKMFRRIAKTVKMENPALSKLFNQKRIVNEEESKQEKNNNDNKVTQNNLHNNYYLIPSLKERIFRTKVDMATHNQDHFLKKIHHQCREERLASAMKQSQSQDQHHHQSSSSSSSSDYRCRSESYPANLHVVNAHFLKHGRTNSSLIKKLFKKDQPMYLRLYCTTDSRMGVTNVELSFGSCLSIAIDLMTRDSSVVVDIIMPSLVDHRDNQREWFTDIFDYEFLRTIGKYHGIEVMMSADSSNLYPQLDPEGDRKSIAMFDGCESCIWREHLPIHCIGCCVADSRILAGRSLILNTAASWSERILPLNEMFRQLDFLDTEVNHDIPENEDDVFFSVFRTKEILRQLRIYANFSLTEDVSFEGKSNHQVQEFLSSNNVRSLDPKHWIANEDYLINRYRSEMGRRLNTAQRQESRERRMFDFDKKGSSNLKKRGKKVQNAAENTDYVVQGNDADGEKREKTVDKDEGKGMSDAERWKKISTPDQDWNYCLNNKLNRLPLDDLQKQRSRYSQQRVLVVDVPPPPSQRSEQQNNGEPPALVIKNAASSSSSSTNHDPNNHESNKIVNLNGRSYHQRPKKTTKDPNNHHYEDEPKRKHDVRQGERYLLSIRVTGLHFTTFLEERSASWLPGLDWLQPSQRARKEAKQAIDKILLKSLDKKTYLAVHLRYEEDAFVWTVGVNSDDSKLKLKKKTNVSSGDHHEEQHDDNGKIAVVDRWRAANMDRLDRSRRVSVRHRPGMPPVPPKPDEKYFGLMKHMRKLMNQIEKLAQDMNVGAVFISNAAPIETYNTKYLDESEMLRKKLKSNNEKDREEAKNYKRKHCPWFTGASFFDKTKERTRYGSLVDRLIVESSTIGVVWDPFTGLSSFSQKIYDHRCRRMKGLTTFSYSIGAGAERDGSLVLEC